MPRWGEPGNHERRRLPENPAAPAVDACPVSGRLVRLTADGDRRQSSAKTASRTQKVLVEDWCQQVSSHSIGDLQFGPEGALYASGGEGASFNNVDYGQFGWPQQEPVRRPAGPGRRALAPPSAEGGALRSQDLRTRLGDPAGSTG